MHLSFYDFLFDHERCTNVQLWVDECKTHYYLFVSCIELMSTILKQDICELGNPGARVAQVNEKRMDEYLPRELRYTCRYKCLPQIPRDGPNPTAGGRIRRWNHTRATQESKEIILTPATSKIRLFHLTCLITISKHKQRETMRTYKQYRFYSQIDFLIFNKTFSSTINLNSCNLPLFTNGSLTLFSTRTNLY